MNKHIKTYIFSIVACLMINTCLFGGRNEVCSALSSFTQSLKTNRKTQLITAGVVFGSYVSYYLWNKFRSDGSHLGDDKAGVSISHDTEMLLVAHKIPKTTGGLHLLGCSNPDEWDYSYINEQIINGGGLFFNNPTNILKGNKKAKEKFLSNCDLKKDPLNKEEFVDFTARNPIFLLNECTKPMCSLSRFINPKARQFFVEQIIKALDKSNVPKEKPLVYVSYASGSLFSDYEMILKLLSEGYTIQNVILIDPKFKPLIKFVNQEKNDGHFVFLPKDIDCSNCEQNNDLLCMTFRLAQFLYGINQASSKKIKLFVYPSSEMYAQDCLNKSVQKADLIVANDFADKNSNPYCRARRDLDWILFPFGLKKGGVIADASNSFCHFNKQLMCFIIAQKIKDFPLYRHKEKLADYYIKKIKLLTEKAQLPFDFDCVVDNIDYSDDFYCKKPSNEYRKELTRMSAVPDSIFIASDDFWIDMSVTRRIFNKMRQYF